ncbi:MAG: hypothetical protein A2289_20855 [Deltaproteobacteria bacterium RIFOXYA12_FULL_58_15]|nr:MAG: hypothetical protein A2289_20855 [Deltaproteobacteria bacterium RIFOXYA12_FULL_58_15]OGR11930.1 MAG: hypothetical protein A2341_17185 [Deltaproteobacteria bacterium RIFOXYB12_FULL_58_9]
MTRLRAALICTVSLACIVCGADVVRAEEASRQVPTTSVDPIVEVQSLISAGKLEEAELLLRGLDGDASVLASLLGLIELRRGKPKDAILHFQRVLQLDPSRTAIWLYLGQAHLEDAQPFKALAALREGRAAGESLPSYYRLLAKAEVGVGDGPAAHDSLRVGIERFPKDKSLQLDQVLLLIELGLFATATEAARTYLVEHVGDANGYAVVAETLRGAGRPLEAAAILEGAIFGRSIAKQSDEIALMARLGWAYAAADKHVAAARSFARAISLGGAQYFEAAEQFRLAGKYRQALICNANVEEPRKRVVQRLTIFIDSHSYERAAAMSAEFDRLNGWTDEARFLIAHAKVQIGNVECAQPR